MAATQQIDKLIAGTKDWRGKRLGQLRKLVHQAAPELAEEWKWDTPVFSQNGMVCALGLFKDHVKVNFFKGASLKDPKKIFNAGLEAKASRAIDLFEDDKLDEAAFKQLVKAAVEFNTNK